MPCMRAVRMRSGFACALKLAREFEHLIFNAKSKIPKYHKILEFLSKRIPRNWGSLEGKVILGSSKVYD